MEAGAIRLDRATVRLGDRTALDAFTGRFDPGEVTALIGGDGAGKSTLLRVLAGRLVTEQRSATGPPVDRRGIGYLPAGAGVWSNLTVGENIEFVADVYGLAPARARARAAGLLDRAGLGEARDRLAGRLSGGMRQKLGVILATLHQPGLVLLDEPTTGVDPVSRAELWALIAASAADGATVVFATTYLDEAERATRLYLLGDGRLLAEGTPDDVIAQTPGSIWQAPAAGESARGTLSALNTWRRGDVVYLWRPANEDAAPSGFTPSPGDLENTSIALLLAAERETASGVPCMEVPTDAPALQPRVSVDGGHLVEAADVVRTYGAFTALGGVSLHVGAGEIVGLLGGNGAGKTTLMRILLGLERPSSGTSALFGREPSLGARRRIGYVAQGLGLFPSLSAIENLEFAASVHGVPVAARDRAVAEDLGRTPISSLPLGTRRMLAYLAASGHDPELLVLDEPTSGMDALGRARLWRELRVSADLGTGILITTHYMQEAAQCDRLVILTAGLVTGAGTVQEITAAHTSLTVVSERWEQAFALLREAGLPVLLHGRALRVPGATRGAVERALAPLAAETTISTGRATLEETMMLAEREP